MAPQESKRQNAKIDSVRVEEERVGESDLIALEGGGESLTRAACCNRR